MLIITKKKLPYVGDIKVIKAVIDLEFTSLALLALAALTTALFGTSSTDQNSMRLLWCVAGL